MWTIAYRVYLGPPANGRESIVRGVTDTRAVVARLRRMGPLCWFFCYPEPTE
jgi:hypothetical protein